jgi:hypothetical protein
VSFRIGFGALVHFPDGTTRVVQAYERPERGELLAADVEGSWIVERMALAPPDAERDGQTFQHEVWVKPAG